MFVSSATLRDLIGDEVRDVFTGALTPLWTDAWHLGYASAKSLATGEPADFTAKTDSGHLQAFIAAEGAHWIQQVARTGLGNEAARSESIARTEVARAVNTAAIQCYRDHGVTHKHLLLSPGACDLCKDAAEDGDIPLDAPFSSGGVLGLSHPGDRCVPAPSGVEVRPPLASVGKGFITIEQARQAARAHAGEKTRPALVLLLLRARDEDGKWRYLLQQRPDGAMGYARRHRPRRGGPARAAAVRESTEEIGDLPLLGDPKAVRARTRTTDRTAWVLPVAIDVPFFQPLLNGATPEETAGTRLVQRRERSPPWTWPRSSASSGKPADLREHVAKSLTRRVDEQGQVITLTPASERLQAVGSRWPYPHRSDGAEWPDAGPGAVPGASAGGEPPHWDDDMTGPVPHDTLEPEPGDDGEMPSRGRKPNPPASRFPDQGSEHDDAWPAPQTTLTPPATSVGAPKSGGNDAGHPVVGSVPATTPKPYKPARRRARGLRPCRGRRGLVTRG